MTQTMLDTLMLVPAFMGLGLSAFGMGFGIAWSLRIFEVTATMRDD